MKVIYQKYITREDLKANPDVAYLFGDNLRRMGLGGQAKEMRGEPNAIGVPTKIAPSQHPHDYFHDDDFDQAKVAIDEAFDRLKAYDIVIIPLDGLGTGLAQLDRRAPKIYKFLKEKIKGL